MDFSRCSCAQNDKKCTKRSNARAETLAVSRRRCVCLSSLMLGRRVHLFGFFILLHHFTFSFEEEYFTEFSLKTGFMPAYAVKG